nr:TspO/MBR family protein [uncultured Rhodoblastus sp.]
MQTFWANWGPISVAAGSAVFVAVIGGLTTDVGPWYEKLRFPAIRPPNWLFGPAWTLIFSLTATAGVIAWNEAPDAGARTILLALFAANILLNIAWSPLFFRWRRPDWAFIELIPFWASILALILHCARFSPRAAYLLLPYLTWVTFAGWLNFRVVQLNAPFARSGKKTQE